MQIKFIFALVITFSGNFVALAEKKDTKDETVSITSNFTNPHDEKANNNALANNDTLTGIPQVDYIYDPNLPRELRGYNLSSYPFYSLVPPEEDIHFKCDGLHDGFYASIEHKCQIYHHCVYGIRHDFLCANFTAFDQRTFICHFVSDVDCEGSKKYWNRNDALYMPTTTTSTTTTTTEPPPTVYRRPLRPQRPLRRPLKRRPANDYYYDEEYQDEFYDEPVNRRPIPNRSRPRKPIVEYDYEEEALPRRPAGNRYRFRAKNEELEDDYQESQTSVKQYKASTKTDKLNGYAGERAIYRKDKHRVVEDNGPQATTDISRRFSVRRRINKTPVNNKEQQSEEVVEESKPRSSPPATPEEYVTPKTANPTIYGLPRTPPRIGRPVPMNEKKKYEYPVVKASATTAPQVHTKEEEYTDDVQEYYDNNSDYDYANERISAPKAVAHRPLKAPIDTLDEYDAPVVNQRKRFRNETPYKTERVRKNKKTVQPVYADYEDEAPVNVRRTPSRPNASRPQVLNKQKEEEPPVAPLKRKLIHRAKQNVAVEEEAVFEDEEEEIVEEPVTKKSEADVPRERYIAPVRVMKRPFLPSRGGSPYLPRGLQLVGVGNKKEFNSIRHLSNQNLRSKQQQKQEEDEDEDKHEEKQQNEDAFYTENSKEDEKKVDKAQNYFQNIEKHELQTSQSENAQHTLDLFYEQDYDVTINDALNPTLTPLSSQSLSHQSHRN